MFLEPERLPGYAEKVWNVVEVVVAADDWLAMLPRQGSDPEVIFRDWPPLPAELIPYLGVRRSCGLVNRKDGGLSDEGLQKDLEMFAVSRAKKAITVFTNDNDRQVMALLSSEHLAEGRVADEKSGDCVGV
jgi:hypothetical protein